MKIVVCIKQVPSSSNVKVDEKTGSLIRNSAGVKMNPFDLFALESALRIKEKYGAEITALTMGPPQAERILKEAYKMGVDNAVLITDRAFAGSDVLATSYTLSQAIRKIGGVDLIICGKQTTDGDTAQVGPAISEYLDIPHAAWVSGIDSVKGSSIFVWQELDEVKRALIELTFPALITVEKDIFEARLPSYMTGLKNKDKAITTYTLKDMPDINPDNYGLSGSATQVERIFPPDDFKEKVVLDGSDKDIGEILVLKLKDAHIL
ncbi:MAG: electron transfer flavoprotein subunit beta/FixA family protein [Clostridiales bacterium]|jgi:electron transfer flavoprotein beta subunit|nr:electron transfer flavoprotein subunit beta/FixA family protein [Clostridiales bacterium]